tara:strand:+ start:471 stop:785 length:315 start_codon:yes stop_codon:yes gene_type:complete
MMASRGMGDIAASKMPKGVKKARRDDTDFTQYKEGGKVKEKYMKFSETGKPIGMTPVTKAKGGPVGLYANINAKRKRGEKMRKPGQKGAPTAQAFIDSAKTARK